MKKYYIYFALLCICIPELYAQTHYIPFGRTLNKGGTDFELDTEYFSTQKVADSDGQVTDLTSDESHEQMDFNLIGKYGVTGHLELLAGIRGRYITTAFTQDFGSGEEQYTLTTSGLESYLVGARYSFKKVERMQYTLEGYYRQATYSNLVWDGSSEPQELAFGEGSREYAAGLNISYQTQSNNVLETKILYRSPGEELSQEIFTNLRAGLVWSNLSLYGGLEAVFSRKNDPYTTDEENKPLVFQKPSYAFNGVNRSWTAPYLGINFALGDKWRLGFKVTLVNNGTSTDLGPRYYITIGRRADTKDDEFGKKNSRFKQYRVEGVVSKVSKSKKVVVIDKGQRDNLRPGMKVDFYYFDFVGGNELIGTGTILKVQYSKALVKILRRYSRRRIKEGIVARSDEILE